MTSVPIEGVCFDLLLQQRGQLRNQNRFFFILEFCTKQQIKPHPTRWHYPFITYHSHDGYFEWHRRIISTAKPKLELYASFLYSLSLEILQQSPVFSPFFLYEMLFLKKMKSLNLICWHYKGSKPVMVETNIFF